MRGRLICPLCAKSGHREQQPRQQKTPERGDTRGFPVRELATKVPFQLIELHSIRKR
jgi:hypothetical protein